MTPITEGNVLLVEPQWQSGMLEQRKLHIVDESVQQIKDSGHDTKVQIQDQLTDQLIWLTKLNGKDKTMDIKPDYQQPEIIGGINFSQIVIDLNTLAETLSIAVNQRFMAPEHAKKVWRKWLNESQLDVPIQDKGGESRGTIEEN